MINIAHVLLHELVDSHAINHLEDLNNSKLVGFLIFFTDKACER